MTVCVVAYTYHHYSTGEVWLGRLERLQTFSILFLLFLTQSSLAGPSA